MVGSTVGRYRITGHLGDGGMGSVWEAEDLLLGRTVALKFLPEKLTSDTEARRRFLHEARAASALSHPGIATVFDAGEASGRLYIAVSYIRGVTVSERVAAGPLPIAEAVRIAIDAAEALGHAHARGVVHRDVSGRNVMVAEDGRVVVLDFGLALHQGASRITQGGSVLGTIAYTAPEVVQGAEAGPRSDLYGLGALLYEMLTGTPPHVGERAAAILYDAVHRVPQPPSAGRPEVPRELDRVVLRALAKNPEERYGCAAELVDELRVAGGPGARPSPPALDHEEPSPPRRPLRRSPPVPDPVVHSDTVTRGFPRSGPQSMVREKAVLLALPVAKFLAVLPFRDLSSEPRREKERQLLAEGLGATISASLARYSGIHVIPPATVARQDTLAPDLDRLAQDLGANLVLEGTVKRTGERLRITYSLLQATSGLQITADTIDGLMSDLLGVEDRVVESVVQSLDLKPLDTHRVRAGLRDAAAHEHYLQALGYLQRYDNEASVDGAVTLLEKLLVSEGENAPILAALGRAYLAKYQLTLMRSWQQRAVEVCERALELDPHSVDLQVALGVLHNVVGRYAQATREFQKALRLRSDHPDALLGLASAYDGADKYSRAEAIYRRYIAQRPNNWAGYNRLGVLCLKQGRYAEAADLWRRVVELTPDNARGYYNLAASLYHMGRYEDAIASYRRSLEIQPSATAYSNLGTVHFFMGNYNEAATLFEKGAALKPYDAAKWANLGDAYRWIPGSEDKAAKAYEQAITLVREQLEMNPRNGNGWARLANWLAKRGEAREAMRAVRRARTLSPRDLAAIVLAIQVHELVGNRSQALACLEQAVKLGYDQIELERDPELRALREDKRFHEILKEQKRA